MLRCQTQRLHKVSGSLRVSCKRSTSGALCHRKGGSMLQGRSPMDTEDTENTGSAHTSRPRGGLPDTEDTENTGPLIVTPLLLTSLARSRIREPAFSVS